MTKSRGRGHNFDWDNLLQMIVVLRNSILIPDQIVFQYIQKYFKIIKNSKHILLIFSGGLRGVKDNKYQYIGDVSDILLDSVECTGKESNIGECQRRSLPHSQSDIRYTVGVECAKGKFFLIFQTNCWFVV